MPPTIYDETEQSEAAIQQNIFMWYQNNYCTSDKSPRSMILSIPNEGSPRLHITGMTPGAADLLVIHQGTAIFVEVKTPSGKQSKKQKKFEDHCQDCGVPYYVVRSLKDFKEIIEEGEGAKKQNTNKKK